MKALRPLLNRNVAAGAFALASFLPGIAQADKLDDLFERLPLAEGRELSHVEEEIWLEWSKSGSPAMDLLLRRGREALEAGDPDLAIGHLTALIDHAPDFAEGYNGRATAYFQKGLYGPALADISRALELEPRHFAAMSGLAIMLDEMNRPREALEVYRMVEEIHPKRDGLSDAIDRLEAQVGDKTL